MEPPLIPTPDEGGATQFDIDGHLPARDVYFDPVPARPGPDFEHDAVLGALLPLAHVKGNRFIPGARRDRWAFGKFLAFCDGLLFPLPPLVEMGVERFS